VHSSTGIRSSELEGGSGRTAAGALAGDQAPSVAEDEVRGQEVQASPAPALQCIPYFRERHKILHILCIRVRECESILDQSGFDTFNYSLLHTMVPYVISPTRACGGSKLKLMIKESFKAFKESSSWHVSTTNKKIGGAGAGRASLYSIVEYPGDSSSGHAFGPISL
jgi:hypothetical protein